MSRQVEIHLREKAGATWVPLAGAAAMVGKSDRQLRYLIKTERITAIKEHGRWLVSREDLQALRVSEKPLYHHSTRILGDRPDFLEVEMSQLLEETSTQGETAPDPEKRTGEIDSAWHIRISRPDGARLEMTIPQPGNGTAKQLMSAFLGG